MIKLRFKSKYKSIKALPDYELPNLAVLTGVNGSGKTHLFEAIANRSVVVEGVGGGKQVRYYNWTNFAPQISQAGSPHSTYQSRQHAIAEAIKQRDAGLTSVAGFFAQHGISGSELLGDPRCLISADEAQIGGVLKESLRQGKPIGARAANFLSQFIQHRTHTHGNFEKHLKQYGGLHANLVEDAKRRGCSLLDLDDEAFEAAMPVFWGKGEVLQLQLAEWFAAWHAAYEYNKINRYYAETENDEQRKWLSDHDFKARYGPEPWELTNRVLEATGVRYRFNRPDHKIDTIHTSFQLRITDPDDGGEIPPQDLSSGEKIILAVTMLLYQTTEQAIMTELPKLLLLDEVDAPLHPSFTRILLRILKEDFVERCGVSVILATHSPSTVALAPEGSVFELVRSPRAIRPVSSSTAAQILSDGFVVLAPTDIMVITESGADVGYYGAIYKALCDQSMILESPSLKFIPASNSVRERANGGCMQVRNWAPKLSGLGFDRFRGLVDMDSGVSGDSVITVLGRYSWENYLFDPITVIAFVLHRGVPLPFADCGTGVRTPSDLINLSEDAVENLVMEFSRWVETQVSIQIVGAGDKAECAYVRWEKITLPKWYVFERGHDIEKKLREALNIYSESQRAGPLVKKDDYREMLHLQANVAPQLISRDFVGIFERLRVLPGGEGDPVPVGSASDSVAVNHEERG